MRLATWNVNSLRARLERIERWLECQDPDVLCLQETKCDDEAFPRDAFERLGYESLHHGDGRWNGVAILSKVGLEHPKAGFRGELVGMDVAVLAECRLVSATCAGVEVTSVYVPNGRVVGSEHYEAKLTWLARLATELAPRTDAGGDLVVCGDFNIAPRDEDVFDVEMLAGATHVTRPERAALQALLDLGLEDLLPGGDPAAPERFTWWDYRGGAFHRGQGMRIDLLLASRSLAGRVRGVFVDRDARKKGAGAATQPSDHAPVVVDLAD